MSDIRVNDGGGLFDSVGLIDTLTMDCNEIVRTLATGNYVSFCAKIVEMIQKLTRLKDGVQKDLASRDENIRELKKLNNDLSEKAFGLPVNRENEDA